MPRASAWLIRLSLLHLLSGAILGAAYLSFKATGVPAFVATHRAVHVDQKLARWMIQLVVTADETQDVDHVADVLSSDLDPDNSNNHAEVMHEPGAKMSTQMP